MAAPQLPFLWPMLFKSTNRAAVPVLRRRAIHVSARQRQETIQQRYGSANEPPPHVSAEQRGPISSDLGKGAAASVARKTKKADQTKEETARTDGVNSTDNSRPPTGSNTDKVSARQMRGDPMLDATDLTVDTPPMQPPPPPPDLPTGTAKPTESLLDKVPDPATPNAPSKESAQKTTKALATLKYDEHQPPVHLPHMDTPRHVHHFDTFGLVKRLEDSGWKNDQSVTLMKAVRLMLADNMDLAREALVSKSQVENETYLFKAACSELKTEVSTRRKGEQDKMRTQRTQLQHELDILNQRLGQDSVAMKDDLKGMFDDRKMSVRNEQREMERKIAELNYKITVSLQADSKSDVEGLRWIMTRRVIITLGLIVVMVLTSLKLFSNAMHDKEQEQKRRARMRNASTQSDAGTPAMPEVSVAAEMLKEGENPAYVSLG